MTSPLADLTILTVFATQTDMAKHIKTAIVRVNYKSTELYVLVTASLPPLHKYSSQHFLYYKQWRI